MAVAQSNKSENLYFCSLYIRSNSKAKLPSDIFKPRKSDHFEFTDNNCPERRGLINRLWAGSVKRKAISRYSWVLSTEGHISGYDFDAHLAWILDHIKSGEFLSALNREQRRNFDYGLSFYWEGNGTGGGPLLTAKALRLLSLHQLKLNVNFYLEN